MQKSNQQKSVALAAALFIYAAEPQRRNSQMLKPNVQLFAGPENNPLEKTDPPAAGKTYSEDYVSALRGESAGYRTRAKSYETALRTALGVKDGEELGDLNARLATYQQNNDQAQATALQKANDRLIKAEMRTLEGYDHKLLAKVIDLSGVKVSDDGAVTGLKEAAEAAAEEYPSVRKTPPQFSRGTKGPTKNMDNGKDRANAALRAVFGKE